MVDMDIRTAREIFQRDEKRFIEDWKSLLRFSCISTDPAYNGECTKCAEWLVTHLLGIGFSSKLLPTPGKPVVFAERDGEPGHPTLVFYGHYDVQPVDPLELWESKPFEPELRNGRLYARGAQDNKGQLMYVLKALEMLVKRKELKCGVKLFIEGEEEHGSEGIDKVMSDWKELKGDVLMVCDFGVVPSGAPTITMGLRGIVALNFKLTGPSYDLHSGVHGGVAANPAIGIAKLVASLHDQSGRVAVEGFYEGVKDPSVEERKFANAEPWSDDAYKAMTGANPSGGEKGFSAWERRGLRPTLEINGIHSGYGGPGAKTIIPSIAEAKITCRLVPGQDPKKTMDRVAEHLKRHTPLGLKCEVEYGQSTGGALSLPVNSKVVHQAKAALDQISDQQTALWWEGASVPIVAKMIKVSGAEPLLLGFGREEDRIHAPNESFSIEQFRDGFLFSMLYLSSL